MIDKHNDINISNAVADIKHAIVVSQSRAIRMVSGEQLSLYFGIGLYVSKHSRDGYWGTGAIDAISAQLKREMPGLRGFSAENIKKMRTFAEFWEQYLLTEHPATNRSLPAIDLQTDDNQHDITTDCFSLQKWSPVATEVNREEFLTVSFTHHMEILHKTKNINEVLFYIHQTNTHLWNKIQLREALKADIYKATSSQMPSNFPSAMPTTRQAMKAIRMFKDEYLLDYINVEDIVEEYETVDERVVEHEIVRNIKTFIMTLGRDFCFIGNQYPLEIHGEERFPDLLFFNRELNSLVVIELKMGKFKEAYLGQLSSYMQILDDKVRKPHENPTIGIVLCKEMNKSFAEYCVRDYSKPMGVATYKTLDDMPEPLRNTLPDIQEMTKMIDNKQKQ